MPKDLESLEEAVGGEFLEDRGTKGAKGPVSSSGTSIRLASGHGVHFGLSRLSQCLCRVSGFTQKRTSAGISCRFCP